MVGWMGCSAGRRETTTTEAEETEHGIGSTRFLCFGQSKTVLGTLNIILEGSSVVSGAHLSIHTVLVLPQCFNLGGELNIIKYPRDK